MNGQSQDSSRPGPLSRSGAGRRHGPGDAGADARHAGQLRPVHPGRRQDVRGLDDSANVISTAGDAPLSVADPSCTATGHLVNGAFSLPQPLQARARNAANTGTAYNNVGSSASPLNLLTYAGPISNDAVRSASARRSTPTTPCARARTQDADVHAVDDDPVAAAIARRVLCARRPVRRLPTLGLPGLSCAWLRAS